MNAKHNGRRGRPEPRAAAASMKPAELTERQRRHLRGLAHALKAIVRVGSAGLTPGVISETDRALHDHELIKVKAAGGSGREAREVMFSDLAARTGCALVQRIGNVAVLYRPRPELPRILIPDGDPAG